MNKQNIVSERGRHHVAGSSTKRFFTPIKIPEGTVLKCLPRPSKRRVQGMAGGFVWYAIFRRIYFPNRAGGSRRVGSGRPGSLHMSVSPDSLPAKEATNVVSGTSSKAALPSYRHSKGTLTSLSFRKIS